MKDDLRGSDYVESLLSEKIENSSVYTEKKPFLYIDDIKAHGFYFRYMDTNERNRYLKEKFGLVNKWKKPLFQKWFGDTRNPGKYFPGINRIIAYLHAKDALFLEGITRFSGRIEYSETVRKKLKECEKIDLKEFSPYELISGIKQLVFKDMNGLFNDEAYYIIQNIDPAKLENMCVLFLNCLISIMDRECGFLFIYYLRCLGYISKMKHKTRMGGKALAVTFTPVFIGEKRLSKESVENIQRYILIIERIIDIFLW